VLDLRLTSSDYQSGLFAEMRVTKNAAKLTKRQGGSKQLPFDNPTTAPLDGRRGARAILLIGLLALVAYANSLGGEFVFDDTDQIVENQNLRSWDNLAKASASHVWAFREHADSHDVPPPLPYYRPLFTALLTIEFHLNGLWPQGWHLTSLLLHILCAVGVFCVVLLISARQLVALIASAVFAVHPVHAESVAWISGMTDPLFGVFFLASFYLYLKARASDGKHWYYRLSALSLGMFVLAAFSKETALSLVLLIFGYEFIATSCAISGRLLAAIKQTLPYTAAALLYLVPRYFVLGELMWRNPQAPARPLAYTLLTLPSVVGTYVLHLIWPVGLSVAYNTHFVTAATSVEFLLPATALLLAAIALFIFRKRINLEVWQALLLVVVPLLPVLNLGQVSRAEYLVFDHYLYLSVAGFGYLIGIGIARISAIESNIERATLFGIRRSVVGVALSSVVVLGSTIAVARENRHWSDSYSLWSNAAQVRPHYWAAHYNTGLALLDARRFDEARASLEFAHTLKPDEADVLDALGRAYDGSGDTANAVASFKRAIEINPEIFESYNNLGALYFKNGNYKLAQANFSSALRLKPQATASRFNLALCYAREGLYSNAKTELEAVISAAPDDAEAFYELGLAYERMGQWDEAALAFSRGQQVAKSPQLIEKLAESLTRLKTYRPSG
jgi:Flp pilus assembly protein TadD